MNILEAYPVGTVLFYFDNNTDPNVLIGGTWERRGGTTFQGVTDGEQKGGFGGMYLRMYSKPTEEGGTDYGCGYVFDTSKGRTLSVDKLPKHTHQVTATFPKESTSDDDYLQYNSGGREGYRNSGTLEYTTESTGGGGADGKPINFEPDYVCLSCWERTA